MKAGFVDQRGMPCRAGRAACGALLAAVVALGFWPVGAEAGTYTVWSCRGPVGEPLSTGAWEIANADPSITGVELSDTCASGGSVRVALTAPNAWPAPQQPRGQATFQLPAGTQIVDYTLWRAVRAVGAGLPGPYVFAAAVRETASGATTDRGCASFLAPPDYNCSVDGDFGVPLSPSNEVAHTGVALDGLQLWAACLSSGCSQLTFPSYSAEFQLFGSRVVVEDLTAPAAPQLSGSLVGSEPVTGVAPVTVHGGDPESGIAAMTLSVDGGPSQTIASGGSCQEPYTLAQPCPTVAARTFSVDTVGLADGAHSLAGTITDAAGNTTSYGPVAFTVAHPPVSPPAASPAPAVTPAPAVERTTRPTPQTGTARLRLTARASVKRLRPGQKVTFAIRVSNPSNVAVRDVRVCHELPSGLAYVSSRARARLSGGRYCWTVGTLRAETARTMHLTARALNGSRGSRTSRAVATSQNARAERANSGIRVVAGTLRAGGVTG